MATRTMRTPALPVVPGALLATLVFHELARAWFPAVLLLIGDAGTTSALLLAPLGLLPLLVPLASAASLPTVPPHRLWQGAIAVLVVARGALVLAPGGAIGATLAAIGLAAAGTALVAVAAGVPGGAAARLAVLLGTVAASALHAALRTVAPSDGSTLVRVAVGSVLVVLLAWGLPRTADALRSLGGATSSARASRWLLLGPLFVLTGILTAVPGRISLATGWPSWQVAATLVVLQLVSVGAAAATLRLGSAVSTGAGGLAVLLGTAGALQPRGWVTIGSMGLLCAGLGALVATDPPGLVESTARRRGLAVAGGIALFGVIVGVYYSSYDVALPFGNRWLLVATAGFGSIVGLVGALGVTMVRPPRTRRPLPLFRAAAVAVLAVVAVGFAADTEPQPTAVRATTAEEVRVALYNVRLGHDVRGRFAWSRQAEALRAEAPDVVVLNEVDRGWYVAGGHDVLDLIAQELGFPHVRFAPAADEVFGNALLSRFPIVEFASERLPRGNDPMPRSYFAAVLDIDQGRDDDQDEDGLDPAAATGQPLAIIGTHLSHVDDQGDTRLPQARAVAGTVARLRERQLPTILAGDLNAPPDSAELASFAPFLEGVLPPGAFTYPSDAPVVAIDHILASPDLQAVHLRVPETTASDHRPVVVTFRMLPTG